jgi:uncharacterized protein (DUF2141 family)
MIRLLSTALLAGLLASPPALADGQTLEVELLGIQHERGALRIGLYSEPKTFRKEAQALAIQQIPARAGNASVRFTDLPAGRYAIMAYHDEDGNGELNRRFGMFPTEGYALSNNPTVMGPPSFEDSAFEVVEGGENRVRMEIRY